MLQSATINATILPRIISFHSSKPRDTSVFISSIKLAPKMVGIASKKENATTVCFGMPISVPPMRVDPARDIPGIKEKICMSPTRKAFL